MMAIASPAMAEKWDMPTPYGDTTFHTHNISQFADDVRTATIGGLDITVHSAGSLFPSLHFHRPLSVAQKFGHMDLWHGIIALCAIGGTDVVLCCFLGSISVVVLTTSIIMPMVTSVGIDRLWFGIYLVIVVEMSQITPPVGFNLFVIQGLTGINILLIAKAAFPFFLLLLLGVALITVFPQIATFLPNAMNG